MSDLIQSASGALSCLHCLALLPDPGHAPPCPVGAEERAARVLGGASDRDLATALWRAVVTGSPWLSPEAADVTARVVMRRLDAVRSELAALIGEAGR